MDRRESLNEDFSLEIEGVDTKAWKSDPNCIICNCKFGKIGLAHSMKYFCKFCFRGVCGKCSIHRQPHPLINGPQRTCENCYKPNEDSDSADLKKTLHKIKSLRTTIKNEDTQKETLNEQLRSTENRFHDLKEELMVMHAKKKVFIQEEAQVNTGNLRMSLVEENKKIRKELEEKEDFNFERNSEWLEALELLNVQLNREESENESLRGKMGNDESNDEYESVIDKLENELDDLRKELERLRMAENEASMESLDVPEPIVTKNCKCFIF